MAAESEAASTWWGRRFANWWWRVGLGVPVLLGAVLAFGVLISLVSDGYERPSTLEAGQTTDYDVGAPKLFEEDDVWLVRSAEIEFLALYDRGLESGCPLQWRREFEFMDRSGWFVDTCTGSAYDLFGRCFSQACSGRSLDRFAVQSEGGELIVDLRELIRGPISDTNAEPVTPTAQ
ncbi:MAG TPA: hypothetical protein VGR43_02170 [Dehalococcoidia bacterium]|jgi:hypothetical protein|nr:hypothetical protein [Dehalococcoidia bacterium]